MFNIILNTPQIPGNTGNIIRLSAATGATLHLIKPLGFSLENSKLRRAGLDYHDLVDIKFYKNFSDLCYSIDYPKIYAFTTKSKVIYTNIKYKIGDGLLFGQESTGLPKNILEDRRIFSLIKIPILSFTRSLNLANAVSIVLYEAWRQNNFLK